MLVRTHWLVALLSLHLWACDDCDRDGGRTIRFSGGISQNGVYQSSSVWGPWLEFPGGRRYSLEHHLGRAPQRVTTYLSFSALPFDGGDEDGGANFTPGAGDATLVERMDQQSIIVRNGTCSDFFLRVVAEAGTE